MNIKWKILEQDFANFELSNTQLRLAAGDGGDNYLCGNCGHLLAEKIPRDIKNRLGIHTVRCPNCKKVNKVEWHSAVSRCHPQQSATLSRKQPSMRQKLKSYTL